MVCLTTLSSSLTVRTDMTTVHTSVAWATSLIAIYLHVAKCSAAANHTFTLTNNCQEKIRGAGGFMMALLKTVFLLF